MIDHITISVKNLEESKTFYEKAFKPLGYKVSFGKENIFWAFDIGSGCLFEIQAHKTSNDITPVHVAFRASDHESVNAFYAAALAVGAKDNGSPGPRPQYGECYYACFVLDPDGHNIEAMHNLPADS